MNRPRILITSGGTSAPIDDIRTITNSSTGRFGSSLAEAALELGGCVTYLHAPSALTPYARLARFDLVTDDPAAEFRRLASLREVWLSARDRLKCLLLRVGTVPEYSATLERLLRTEEFDVIFLAMAVSDYAPEPEPGKIDSDPDTLTVVCRRQPKVIRSVRDWSPGIFLVGFKLLSGVPEPELIAEAERACLTNRANLTIANDMTTVREGRHTVHLVRPGHPAERIGPGPDMPMQVVRRTLEFLAERGNNTQAPNKSTRC